MKHDRPGVPYFQEPGRTVLPPSLLRLWCYLQHLPLLTPLLSPLGHVARVLGDPWNDETTAGNLLQLSWSIPLIFW